jgi:hypothetical protein
MKIKSILIIAVVMLSLSLFIYGQCPQICDSNENTALGQSALVNTTIGGGDTAVGYQALSHNANGYSNTAIGANALYSNLNAYGNTAIGASALQNDSLGWDNTATGHNALNANNGKRNTATGSGALANNISADHNTAIGYQALANSNGPGNVAVGSEAGAALTTGNGNVCLGAFVSGFAGENNTTRIRNVYSSVASDRAVYVTADNKIGTLVSSRKFKEDIKPLDKASEAILALKPVSFRYKKEIESNGSIMFGLIAEDVEKADPDLVTRNEKGEPETVRYDAVNAMLLNEFLKEQKKVEQQETTITQLKKELQATTTRQQKQIETLTAGLQKVSAQLELNKRTPETVSNNQ